MMNALQVFCGKVFDLKVDSAFNDELKMQTVANHAGFDEFKYLKWHYIGSCYLQMLSFVIRRDNEKYYNKMTNQSQDIIEKQQLQLPLLKWLFVILNRLFVILLRNNPAEGKYKFLNKSQGLQ